MAHIYVTTSETKVGIEGGRLTIKNRDETIRTVPKQTVESITVFGNAVLSTQCIQFCLTNGISVSFFSGKGKYFGRLESTAHHKVEILEQQIDAFRDNQFCLELCKRIISAKIRNQEVVLRRYAKDHTVKLEMLIKDMKIYRDKVEIADGVERLLGYEGMAARTYFEALSEIIELDFKFNGRSRRPPRDPFNSMLSLGYTLLMYEIYPKVENEGMSPYYAVLHKNYANHPALISDLMEEWRSVIVDSTVLSLVQGHEITSEHFEYADDSQGVFLTKEGLSKFINKFEKTMNRTSRYLLYDQAERTMRKSIQEQCRRMRIAIANEDVNEYAPVIIR
ncbi:CRISPR-associated endonuclease Cas1 [Mogibacterium diversum]|uniref:CRISPR-associated endonuclease Cas1 n=1 Tax=Mogibacterium diversum TaxID=114527 RepID=UPI0028D75CFD|nr:CRISPR-associated endonuclease Cas1 [Mogibacterium diversum]